ncbi:hypothetical protein EDWATA_02122 [Edwardsiella tarda ATCC 23685]|uniref:Uncharacterized protein n=1 Tax=Edwardsiella tarda ATCC 23685 TaxID=500638 RepID=D4F5U4_EDWTA|nr:hypothetical protein EDWATA_02122 [Edwardsiella tarda ATCC 23685]BEH72373.1 hypothetical protein GBS0709_14900 [Edwardsiella tarda]
MMSSTESAAKAALFYAGINIPTDGGGQQPFWAVLIVLDVNALRTGKDVV